MRKSSSLAKPNSSTDNFNALVKMEKEEKKKVRKDYEATLDRRLREIHETYQDKIKSLAKDYENCTPTMDVENLDFNNPELEKKRKQLEADVKAANDNMTKQIDKYLAYKKEQMDKVVHLLQDQMDADIEFFNETMGQMQASLMATYNITLELADQAAKNNAQLKEVLEKEKIKDEQMDKYEKELTKMSAQMADEIEKVKNEENSLYLAQLDEILQKVQDEAKKNLELQEKLAQETQIAANNAKLAPRVNPDQREFERRTRMKRDCLKMLAMADLIKLTDEEFITAKYHYKIFRNDVVYQNKSSIIYRASSDNNDECVCKVTMLREWNIRWIDNFSKYGSKVTYFASTYGKKRFCKVYSVMMTDTKIYTFMEQLKSTMTLENVISKRSADKVAFKKPELVRVIIELTEAVRFLNEAFIAHMDVVPNNVVLSNLDSESASLSKCKVVLTGITHPIIFYNVESDEFCTTKGFSNTEIPMDHLPPECWDESFHANYCDTYSIGHIIYMMIKYKSPFANMQTREKLKIKKDEPILLPHDDPNLVTLVQFMTHPVNKKRIILDEVVDQEYFK